MNAECHIWLSVCAVLTSMLYNHFQWLHWTAVHWNIYTNNQAINQNHMNRLYLFHPNIHLTYVANLLACFQLDIYHSFFSLKKSNLDVMSSVVKLIMDVFLKKSSVIIESIIGLINYLLRDITLFLYIKKSSWRQPTCSRFDEMWYIVKYFIVDFFSFLVVCWLVKIQDENNIYISYLNSTEP